VLIGYMRVSKADSSQTLDDGGHITARCAPRSALHARHSIAMSTRTVYSSRMTKSYSAECEHGRSPFRAAEVDFENDKRYIRFTIYNFGFALKIKRYVVRLSTQ
jgi:hypothetical protein